MIARQNAWEPYYCIDAMRATINQGLLQADRESTRDWSKIVAQQAMERTICTLSTSMGSCIRVKSTGLPVAYNDILYAIGGTFFVTVTVAWAPHTGFYTPIITLIIYIVVKLIVGVGNDMEDPFGHDESDLPLPLDGFCTTIERQINAIDERADKKPRNKLGPWDYRWM